MFAKPYRLSSRLVHALVRKSTVFHGRHFSFSFFPQKKWKRYNQLSFHVAKKVHKSAVKRNFVKRVVVQSLLRGGFPSKSIAGSNYVIFARINKRQLSDWVEVVANNERKDIKSLVSQWFSDDYRLLVKKLSK